jgi:hypothetical protein
MFRPPTTQLIATPGVQQVASQVRAVVRKLTTADGPERLDCYVHDPVSPYDPAESEARVRSVSSGRYREHRLALNLTGGTTLMGLGARRAAEAGDVELLYVDTDNGRIIVLSPVGEVRRQIPIEVQVSVETYLAAHGATVSPKRPWGRMVVEEAASLEPYFAAAQALGRAGSGSQRLLDALRPACSREGDGTARLEGPTPLDRELAGVLQHHGMVEEVAGGPAELRVRISDDRQHREFLTGHWLELYVYRSCSDAGFFHDVRLSVVVKREGEKKAVENECDVLVTLNGRLALISCKSGRLEHKDENRAAVYELDSLLQAELMGLYARKVLASNRARLPDALVDRARPSQIECIAGDHLPDVATRIRACLQTGPR